MSRDNRLEALAEIVVNCGFEIHRDLGPGLLEGAYEALLAEGLRQAGLTVARQVSLPMTFRGVTVANAYKLDLLVEEKLIVEVKSIDRLSPVHVKQLLTYLRLSRLPLGFVMNFGQPLFKDGVRRIANDYFGGQG